MASLMEWYGHAAGNDSELCDDLPRRQDRNSCHLDPDEHGLLDGVAMIRMIVSLLGFLGALSIVLSAIAKKKICSSEVHPIFMMSVADFFMSILWITGSALWMTNMEYNRVYCYPITLLTGIFECVTVNLTLVYALLAYIRTTKTELHTLLAPTVQKSADLSKKKLTLVYLIAWLLPVVIILPVFGIVAMVTGLVSSTQACSCWCRPTIVNVLPFAKFKSADLETTKFLHKQIHFIVYIGYVISIQYIIVFPLLLIFYIKILLRIKRFRREFDSQQSVAITNYGTSAILARGHSQARTRVVLFLTVFVITGFFNLCCTLFLAVVLGSGFHDRSAYFVLLYAQSITLPLQGFLNAIVYGWTRDDFISVMSIPLSLDTDKDPPINDPEGIERSFTETMTSQSSLLDSGVNVQ